MWPGFEKYPYILVDTEFNSSANSNNELFLVYECQHLITSVTQFKLLLSSPQAHVMIKAYRTARHFLEKRETSCIHEALKITAVKKLGRLARRMLCFLQRSLLHYVLLLEIEAKLTRWAPLMGQAHIRVPANLLWCGVTCRKVPGCSAGGSLAESSKAPGGMSVGQLLTEGSLMGWATLLFCLKTNLKAVQQFYCFLLAFTLTTGAACGSPQCLQATFPSGSDSEHVSSR